MGKIPKDLGARSTLLVDKHAEFIKKFADVRAIYSLYPSRYTV